MPIHDWMRVDAGIFHDFHFGWIYELKRALNHGLLPPDYYAMAEQHAGVWEPDVLTLEGPPAEGLTDSLQGLGRGIALAEVEPKVSFRQKTAGEFYEVKTRRLAIRHVTRDNVVAVIEIVSRGNKRSRAAIRKFAEKAAELLTEGIHLLVADLFPPGPGNPQGIHPVIWEELDQCDFVLPPDRRLTVASYIGGVDAKEAFIEPVAVGAPLPDMPLFLSPKLYVQVPLEQTYQAAFAEVPSRWQTALRF